MGKEYRPRMLESRVLRKLSGPKTETVTGEWRQVHYEEFSRSVLLVKYYWKDKFNHELGRACGTYWKRRGTYWGVPAVKTEGKRSLGRLEGDGRMISK
jgi:hypothetical protein